MIEPSVTVSRESVAQVNDMLTVILGSIEQLRQQPLDERGIHQVDRMEQAGERMSRLLASWMGRSTGEA